MQAFVYDITEHIATLSENKTGNYTIELNKISFNGNPAKYDLRKWDKANGKMLKGITLTDEEAEALKEALTRALERGEKEHGL